MPILKEKQTRGCGVGKLSLSVNRLIGVSMIEIQIQLGALCGRNKTEFERRINLTFLGVENSVIFTPKKQKK